MSGWLWLALTVLVGVPGLVLLVLGAAALLLPTPHNRFLGLRPLLAWVVRTRLGGYRHRWTTPDPSRPTRLDRTHRVAVIGGGLAGISAATALAERGVSVTLLESNTYLGGKIGAWPVSFDDGEAIVEHGFHAFFRHYYNLSDFLDRLGLRTTFDAIEEYAILKPDGSTLGFGGVETTPALNIIALALHGVFDMRAILRDPVASKRMEALLRYDADSTFAAWDQTSFAEFAEQAGLAPDLALSFTTFSRAFFADPDRMSMAELIKSFHFYYLSHDHGLDYDFPVGDYHTTLLEPMRQHMETHGVDIRLGSPVGRVEPAHGGFEVDGDWYDEVVLASHVPGVRSIMAGSPALQQAAPTLAAQVSALSAGQRYAVLRLWLDQDTRDDLPRFVITDRAELLDSVTFFHRYDPDSKEWVAARGGGSVLELHCYAVPDNLPDDAAVRAALVRELQLFFPDLSTARILREHLQVRQDFPAFHQGLWAERPTVKTDAPGLYLAGDWVKLPFPAMLMEAAYTSGLLAANHILDGLGLQQHPVDHVPHKGVLAGLPGDSLPSD